MALRSRRDGGLRALLFPLIALLSFLAGLILGLSLRRDPGPAGYDEQLDRLLREQVDGSAATRSAAEADNGTGP